jgi:hypothetical protein
MFMSVCPHALIREPLKDVQEMEGFFSICRQVSMSVKVGQRKDTFLKAIHVYTSAYLA